MKNRKGFTITELVIVIAVIAILAAVLIPTFGGIINKANDSATLQEARNMYTNYMGEFDYTDGTPDTNLVIKVDGKYVAVKNGQMGDKVYEDLDDAKAASANNATVICDECTYPDTYTDGKCTDCGVVCDHGTTAANSTCPDCHGTVPAAG